MAHQQITQDFWDERSKLDLYSSNLVMQEASAGDQTLAAKRLDFLKPPWRYDDALHVALAAFYDLDYLVTWNCKHIANPIMHSKIEASLRKAGVKPAILLTPEVFLETVLA